MKKQDQDKSVEPETDKTTAASEQQKQSTSGAKVHEPAKKAAPESGYLGATEDEMQQITPVLKDPINPKIKGDTDDDIDPRDELTPG